MTYNEQEEIIIRKVILTMDEQLKYEVIKSLADHPDGNKDRAALTLGCTKRHINRMLAGYRKEGKSFFIHGNKGRKQLRPFLTKHAEPSLISTVRNIMMRTSAIFLSYWKSMSRSQYPPLAYPVFWKANTYFPQR